MEDHRAVNWPISPHHARVRAPLRTGLQRSGPLYPDPESKAELKQHGSVHLRCCPQVKWRASGGGETEKNPLWLSFRGSSSCRSSVYLHAGVQVDSAPCQLCRLIDMCHIKGKMTTRCFQKKFHFMRQNQLQCSRHWLSNTQLDLSISEEKPSFGLTCNSNLQPCRATNAFTVSIRLFPNL